VLCYVFVAVCLWCGLNNAVVTHDIGYVSCRTMWSDSNNCELSLQHQNHSYHVMTLLSFLSLRFSVFSVTACVSKSVWGVLVFKWRNWKNFADSFLTNVFTMQLSICLFLCYTYRLSKNVWKYCWNFFSPPCSHMCRVEIVSGISIGEGQLTTLKRLNLNVCPWAIPQNYSSRWLCILALLPAGW